MRQNIARLHHRCQLLTDQIRSANTRRASKMVRGWIDIADALEVSDTAAMNYAARDVDPLPVLYDFSGRPFIWLRALAAWISRQAHSFRTYHELRRAGRLPGQIRTEGGKADKPKQRRRVKPAVRASERRSG